MSDNTEPKDTLCLKIITPEGQFCFLECESVVFQITDDENGRGSGSYGVRKGHAKSAFSVKTGNISAYKGGKQVLSAAIGDGFAMVAENVLFVTTESASFKE